MAEKALSILTPSYNQSKYVTENIQSVKRQELDDVEHIVLDGGSDDGTVDILKEYDDTYDLRWVSEPDRGQTHALNKGFQMANGEWIGWQNSDDFYLSGAFSKFQESLKENPQADAIYGDLVIVNENSDEISQQFMTRPSKFIQRHWSLFASNQALFVRRSALEKIFPLSEDLEFTMDAELTWRLLERDLNLVHVSEPLGAFRVQPNAKTFGRVRDSQDEELQQIYDYPLYQRVVPSVILEKLAKATKAALLLSDQNFNALWYNLMN